MHRDEIACLIAAEELFTRPSDGRPPPSDQLRLRARKYSHLFECSDPACTRIRLRQAADTIKAASRGRSRRSSTTGERDTPAVAARRRRERAARKYRPNSVDLLLVAEAPPAALDRYFYFEDVREQDALFRYVVRGILHTEPTRDAKPTLLSELQDRGVYLIDLKPEPTSAASLVDEVPGLIRRVERLQPRAIILIKATVYDVAFAALCEAGLPVVDERVPFPGSGQQRRFETAFARALKRARQIRSKGGDQRGAR